MSLRKTSFKSELSAVSCELFLIVSHSEPWQMYSQRCTSGAGGDRGRERFVPAAVQRLWLPVQLIEDRIIIVSFESEAKNENSYSRETVVHIVYIPPSLYWFVISIFHRHVIAGNSHNINKVPQLRCNTKKNLHGSSRH